MIRFILAVVSRHTMACLLLFICVEKRKKYRVGNLYCIIGMGHRTKRILRIERKEYQTY